MIKFRIDKAKTFLPQSIAKGTTEERLQKARLFNIRFYQNLQDSFNERVVKDSAFKRVLQETCLAKIPIRIAPSEGPNASATTHFLGARNTFKGYVIFLPFAPYTKTIKQSSAGIFLNETQKFFNEIFNPKFLRRKVSNTNKFTLHNDASRFYSSNIKGTQEFTASKLEDYLKDKTINEQINFLQMFRYELLAERNAEKAKFQIDKQIEKFEHLQFGYKDYDLQKFHYDEKLAILNEKLKAVLKTAREEIQARNLAKQGN